MAILIGQQSKSINYLSDKISDLESVNKITATIANEGYENDGEYIRILTNINERLKIVEGRIY